MTFAEASEEVWELVDNPAFMRFLRLVHGTADLCLHRSAAILRTPGEGMGGWHQDHRGHIARPQRANDVLNRFPIPSGLWFYLNGSDPGRSGIAVIEKSHHPGWEGPEGYTIGPDRGGLQPEGLGGRAVRRHGGARLRADPGRPGGTSSASPPSPGTPTCPPASGVTPAASASGPGRSASTRPGPCRLRPGPWPSGCPKRLKHYMDGYVGFDGEWRAE